MLMIRNLVRHKVGCRVRRAGFVTTLSNRRVGQLLRRVDKEAVAMSRHIDLCPLLARPAAARVLLSARGQLNRAFHKHGLVPPDPMPGGDPSWIDPTQLEDLAARGIDYARQQHGEAFVTWIQAMPLQLAGPVLDILRQTHRVLNQQDNASGANAAVLEAYEFLLGHSSCEN